MNDYDFLQRFIATRIREIRLSKKLSQEVLSELAGLSSKYIHNVENKNFNIKVQTLEKIIDALGYTPEEFFNFDNNYDAPLLHLIENINALPTRERLDIIDALNTLTDKLK